MSNCVLIRLKTMCVGFLRAANKLTGDSSALVWSVKKYKWAEGNILEVGKYFTPTNVDGNQQPSFLWKLGIKHPRFVSVKPLLDNITGYHLYAFSASFWHLILKINSLFKNTSYSVFRQKWFKIIPVLEQQSLWSTEKYRNGFHRQWPCWFFSFQYWEKMCRFKYMPPTEQ